jgi:hypothetical protein
MLYFHARSSTHNGVPVLLIAVPLELVGALRKGKESLLFFARRVPTGRNRNFANQNT